jgi:hypothetical protein
VSDRVYLPVCYVCGKREGQVQRQGGGLSGGGPNQRRRCSGSKTPTKQCLALALAELDRNLNPEGRSTSSRPEQPSSAPRLPGSVDHPQTCWPNAFLGAHCAPNPGSSPPHDPYAPKTRYILTLGARVATTATTTTRLQDGCGAYDPVRNTRRRAGRVFSTMASMGALWWRPLHTPSSQIHRKSPPQSTESCRDTKGPGNC